MKITAQEEYGLRCILQLARSNNTISVREIASREGLSSAYVEKLLRLLSQAGLTQSERGVHGGYRLTRRPEETTLRVVLQSLGSVPSVQEICDRYTGQEEHCVHIQDCSIRSVWTTLTQLMTDFMDKITLADLLGPEAHMPEQLNNRVTFGEGLALNKTPPSLSPPVNGRTTTKIRTRKT